MSDIDSQLWFDYNQQDIIAQAEASKTKTREVSNSLDKDAFLKLMLTQLQYQDPLSPTDDKEFLAQMAQFTALEQMQNMSATTTQNQAFSMMGRTIEATVYNEATASYDTVIGPVSAVTKKSGECYLIVGNKEVPIGDVSGVYSDPLAAMSSLMNTTQNLELIGKTIQAITVDSNYQATGFVEGKVDYLKFDSDGAAVLVIGDKEVYAKEIVSVGSENMLIGKTISAQVGSASQIVTGTVDDVKIKDDKAYLVIGSNEVPIEKINYATESLSYIGKNVTYKGISGKVDSVVIREGIPYMVVGNKEISYTDYRSITSSTDSSSTSTAEETSDSKTVEDKDETAGDSDTEDSGTGEDDES